MSKQFVVYLASTQIQSKMAQPIRHTLHHNLVTIGCACIVAVMIITILAVDQV